MAWCLHRHLDCFSCSSLLVFSSSWFWWVPYAAHLATRQFSSERGGVCIILGVIYLRVGFLPVPLATARHDFWPSCPTFRHQSVVPCTSTTSRCSTLWNWILVPWNFIRTCHLKAKIGEFLWEEVLAPSTGHTPKHSQSSSTSASLSASNIFGARTFVSAGSGRRGFSLCCLESAWVAL